MVEPGLRVLLIEDNDGDAMLVEEYLAEAGRGQFVVHRARTKAEGQELFSATAPQVVLLDLNLPDSKGIATLETFCASGPMGSPRPPIIVLTSLDDASTAERAIAGCAQNYLVKNDVNARVLITAIRIAIQQHGRHQVDRMLHEGDKADGNLQEAMQVLQRVNRAAPPELPEAIRPRPGRADEKATVDLLLESFITGSKATEVVLTGLDQRVRRLEENRHEVEVRDARRELLMVQLERLLIGNGRGALAGRLEAIERAILSREDEIKEERHARLQYRIALAVLAAGWLVSAIVWLVSRYGS